MIDIGREAAENIAANNGMGKLDEPQAYKVFRYYNSFEGGWAYAVAYNRFIMNEYKRHYRVIEIIWEREEENG